MRYKKNIAKNSWEREKQKKVAHKILMNTHLHNLKDCALENYKISSLKERGENYKNTKSILEMVFLSL